MCGAICMTWPPQVPSTAVHSTIAMTSSAADVKSRVCVPSLNGFIVIVIECYHYSFNKG